MTTRLRLLLDEAVQKEIIEEARKWDALNVECVGEILSLRGKSDKAIIDYASREKRIVVTLEGRMNERKYEICTHPGIIVFRVRHGHTLAKAELFRKFILSGLRAKSKHAITYLKRAKVVFRIKEAGQLKDLEYDLETKKTISAL